MTRVERIVREVATYHEIGDHDVTGESIRPRFTVARHEAWWRIRRELKWSYAEIGRVMGVHHVTVLSGVRRFESRMAADPSLAARMAWP